MTRFEWTDAQRAQAVPGSTVMVDTPFWRGIRAVLRSDNEYVFFIADGRELSVSWKFCDPSSLFTPLDARQLGLFGGEE